MQPAGANIKHKDAYSIHIHYEITVDEIKQNQTGLLSF